ncbi:MAG: permease [Desulfurococcales archaeon]|nr:permease [Desulfurococcales archaeon]
MDVGLVAAVIFLASIAAIVARIVDETVAALAGLVAMVLLTAYTPEDAFNYVDWNVIAILLGMWIIAGYMIEGGFTNATLRLVAKYATTYRRFLLLMAIFSGFISMFIDNVLVILLVGSITIEAARRVGANPILAILLIGFSANFMGTALLMGDLPPQLLHSVAGAEFIDFIWSYGRPSSFPLLTITFIITLAAYYMIFIRREPNKPLDGVEARGEAKWHPLLLHVSLAFFTLTVIGMALRPLLGLPLGFITLAGASMLALVVELWRRAGGRLPSFEEALGHVEWRALLFYATLFSLVGGLEELGVLEEVASSVVGYISEPGLASYTVMYWIVGLLSLFVEHDALLLTFLYITRDAAELAGINPWNIYWGMAWSATLASNATTAAAPALYVAVAIAEDKGYRIRPTTFLKYSLTFASISLVVHYLVTIPFWSHPP